MTERYEAPLVDAIAIIRQVRHDQEGWQATVNDLTKQCLAGYEAEDLVEAMATIARALVTMVAAGSDSTEDRVLDVMYGRIVDLAGRMDDDDH